MITPSIAQVANSTAVSAARSASSKSNDALGQGDFLRLLTVQMQQQDPFDPVDNKEMLAQMAQFSALAGTAETNSQLTAIAEKLDLLIKAQGGLPASSDTEI